jgi:general secretion pathway protein H
VIARRPIARRRRAPGFTLLEILVVVVIIAILTTLGVLSIGVLGGDRELESEVERYTDVLAAALEQAQLEGRDYGLYFGPDSYQVFVYSARKQQWESVTDDRLYALHPLPKGVTLTLVLEARTLVLDQASPDSPPAPQVMLYASGDADPYSLLLRRGEENSGWFLEGQQDGSVKLTKPETP